VRVLLDTNVVLDVLLNRQPFVAEAKQIWQAHDQGLITAYLTATTITDIYYLSRKALGSDQALKAIKLCLDTFQICKVDDQALQTALSWHGTDFEDNLQIACALAEGLDKIVTRNVAHFKTTGIGVMEPADFVSNILTSGQTGPSGPVIPSAGN
jgi:predicted nucleic acid-binding protein